MKKSLLALAVLGAFAGAAHAQSSITVYGSIDAGLRYQTNQGATGPDAGDGKLTMGSNGTYYSNRLGFKGVEDLGGGLNAHFQLETGFNTGTGEKDTAVTNNKFWNRTSSVGIGGNWGSIDLGRQYSTNFRIVGTYDPFNYKYTGIIPLAGLGGLTRIDNLIQYSGKFGPVTGYAEYGLGEQAGSLSNGATYAVGGVYQGGGITVGGAYTGGKRLVGAVQEDLTNWTVGGAWTTGPFRLAAGYNDSKIDTSRRMKDAWVGGSYNLTPALGLSAAYYQTKNDFVDGKRQLGIVGATYALSKRTNFYADVDYGKYDGSFIQANGKDNSTGVSFGLMHLF